MIKAPMTTTPFMKLIELRRGLNQIMTPSQGRQIRISEDLEQELLNWLNQPSKLIPGLTAKRWTSLVGERLFGLDIVEVSGDEPAIFLGLKTA